MATLTLCCFSCKNDTKLTQIDLEQLEKEEHAQVKSLLNEAIELADAAEYEAAREKLEIIITQYGPHEEYLEAKALYTALEEKILVRDIRSLNTIKEVQEAIVKTSSPEALTAADERIKERIEQTNNLSELRDYLNEDGFKKYEKIASQKAEELATAQKEGAYASAVAINNADTWKDYINSYPNDKRKNEIEDKIIRLEVDEIFSGDFGEIPTSQLLGDRDMISSKISIKNDTKYTLTIRYSGKKALRIAIPPRETQTVSLPSGEYRVTASVNAYNVQNFAGTESLYGDYDSSFYISQ